MTIAYEKSNKEMLNEMEGKILLSEDEAYKLCVKADALRISGMYQESVSKYLRAIFNKRDYIDAYYIILLLLVPAIMHTTDFHFLTKV